MPEIEFSRITATRTGENASSGKETELAFNGNFVIVKTLLEQLFAVASITVTSEEITQIKVDTTTTPYTLYYTMDALTSEDPTWIPLVSTSFADLGGDPNDNIALKTILDAKGSASDVATLQTQMSGTMSTVSNLQTTVGNHTTAIGANTSAITQLQSDVNDRVKTPHGDILYLRYVSGSNEIQYSTDGTTWTGILSTGISFASITGNADDNASLVSYVAGEIANALLTISTTYVTQTMFTEHTTDTNNPHGVTKAQVGLGNVDNTSDMNKPISIAVQQALNSMASNMPPVYSMTPDDYRANTPMSGAIYFTSNNFSN